MNPIRDIFLSICSTSIRCHHMLLMLEFGMFILQSKCHLDTIILLLLLCSCSILIGIQNATAKCVDTSTYKSSVFDGTWKWPFSSLDCYLHKRTENMHGYKYLSFTFSPCPHLSHSLSHLSALIFTNINAIFTAMKSDRSISVKCIMFRQHKWCLFQKRILLLYSSILSCTNWTAQFERIDKK